MLKHTKGRASRVVEYKVPLYNFGAEHVFVISGRKDTERRKKFIEAWNHFSKFEYTFIDATFGKDISIPKLLDRKVLGRTFYDPNGSLSKNIVATALSHRKVYKAILDRNDWSKRKFFLILEDDARPTVDLVNDIYSGNYKKTLDKINKQYIDCVWWGRRTRKIAGSYVCEHLQIPFVKDDYSAHSYMINSELAEQLLEGSSPIRYAADTFIDTFLKEKNKVVRSPFSSYIQQQGLLLGKYHMDKKDPDFLFSSNTQINYLVDNRFPPPFSNINKDIKKHIVEVTDHETTWKSIKLA